MGSSGLATQSTEAGGEADREEGDTHRLICMAVLSTTAINCWRVAGGDYEVVLVMEMRAVWVVNRRLEVFSLEWGEEKRELSYKAHNHGARPSMMGGWNAVYMGTWV